MATKLLLDTDIGSDIDDAVALAYLLAKPECDLLGITTVSGEPERRAMLASALCRVAGRDVPIFPGAPQPLLVSPRQPLAPQAEALGRWDHETSFEKGMAVEFLRRTIREHPGEITLLTIGPLTNIALLFAVDPEIPSLLREMVVMGGLFDTSRKTRRGGKWEWNIYCDPHAAEMVFRAPVPRLRCAGLDVTLQVTMSADEVRERFRAPLLEPVLDFSEVWFRDVQTLAFHDPLAAALVFDGGLCGFERGVIDVELHDLDAFATTRFRPGGEGRHEVAMTVEPGRFFSEFFGAFS